MAFEGCDKLGRVGLASCISEISLRSRDPQGECADQERRGNMYVDVKLSR